MSEELNKEFLNRYIYIEKLEKDNKRTYDYFYTRETSLFDCLRHTRNVLTHNKIMNESPVYINVQLLDSLNKLISKITQNAIEISVRRNDMYTITPSDNMLKVLVDMKEKNFSYIPVLDENSSMEYVLTENSLLSYIVNNKEGILMDSNTEIKELLEFSKLDDNRSESFCFIDKNVKSYEVKKIFEVSFQKNKRLACVFITEHGQKNEKILGMLTAWDLLK